MADEYIDPNLNTIVSAQEIDEVVSQFRLFNRRLSHQQRQKLFNELPRVTEADLVASGHQDDVCPICFNAFLATLAEEEVAHAMDSPAHPVDELGVTKLQNTCGHIFCRKELRMKGLVIFTHFRTGLYLNWQHDSCPSCRRPLVTDEERREGGVSPQPGRLPPWLVDSHIVARDAGIPTQLPTLSIDPFHELRGVVENSRYQLAGMYS
ncbi:hypothetical protein HD554DRAFT_2166089 [Boletus coccyginus]|nr:hypothetical protein HD554DRAFT_2166089 [Boletus coccyginus]